MNILSGTVFTLRINGPMQGVVKYYSPFYIALDLNDDETDYNEIGSLSDIEYTISAQKTLFPLMIYSIVFSNNHIRDSINYSFKFLLPNSLGIDLLSSYTYFLIDFPSFFNILLNFTSPSCSLYNLDEKIQINYAQSCSFFGSQIKVMMGKDLIQGYNYHLQLNGIRGPSWETCISHKWIINLISGDQEILLARSFYNTENLGLESYYKNPNQNLLFYQEPRTNSEITSYKITPGVFSYPLAVVSELEAFDKSLTLNINDNSIFTSYPSNIIVNRFLFFGFLLKFFYF